MLTTVLYVVLAVLIATTLYVVVRTLLFAWRQRTVEPFEGVPVDDACVADPVAFARLHRMLEETYPLVHRELKREVISGYSLLYTWEGSRLELEPVLVMAHQDKECRQVN